MTIKVLISCDADRCGAETEIHEDQIYDLDNQGGGWKEHPGMDDVHYCKRCWPACKTEIEEIRGEEI